MKLSPTSPSRSESRQSELLRTQTGLFSICVPPSGSRRGSSWVARRSRSWPSKARNLLLLAELGVKPVSEICFQSDLREDAIAALRPAGICYAEALFLDDSDVTCLIISRSSSALLRAIEVIQRGAISEVYDTKYHLALGRLFGYPQCCVKRFVVEAKARPPWTGYGREPSPDAHEFTAHLWCKADCSRSRSLELRYRTLLETVCRKQRS